MARTTTSPVITGSLVETALVIATSAHESQRDKSGAPYILHPIRVAMRFTDPARQVVALLHDVLEDAGEEWLTLINNRGIPWDLQRSVLAITHKKGEPRIAYYDRIKNNPIAIDVKLADIADNLDPVRMAKLPAEDQIRLRRKYSFARAYVTGLPEYELANW